MAERARVTSVDAIEAFRSHLIVYVGKARPTLEEVTAEVVRFKGWLENDQRVLLEGMARRRTRDLEEAKQALFSARISNLREESTAEQLMYHRAKRALEESEEKLRTLKRWNRDFDNRVQPLVKQMEKLHSVLSNDLVRAQASLSKTISTLAAYTEPAPPPSASGGKAGEPESSGKGNA